MNSSDSKMAEATARALPFFSIAAIPPGSGSRRRMLRKRLLISSLLTKLGFHFGGEAALDFAGLDGELDGFGLDHPQAQARLDGPKAFAKVGIG